MSTNSGAAVLFFIAIFCSSGFAVATDADASTPSSAQQHAGSGLIAVDAPGLAGAVRYFRVAEIAEPCFHCESFVLPLSDPDHIAHAENLITNGPSIGGTIASARIVAGSDGINRNLDLPEQPLWSWHVVGFDGFADLTIELCDGWPSFVENDVEGFILNTQGQICFWGWTVVGELVDEDRGRTGIPVPALSSSSILLLMLVLGALGLWFLRGAVPGRMFTQ